MKVIKTNTITGITASSSDAGFPTSNLLNSVVKKPWKALNNTVNSATLSVTTLGTTDSFGVVGVAAESVQLTISTPVTANTTYTIDTDSRGIFTGWFDLTSFSSAATITITLVKSAGNTTVLSVGEIVAGAKQTFDNPNYGLSEGLIDYSIVKELSNGSMYYKKRDIVRTFSGSIDIARTTNFQSFMKSIARVKGSVPLMWQLVDQLGNDFAVYGRLESMPQGSHAYANDSEISFTIVEAL